MTPGRMLPDVVEADHAHEDVVGVDTPDGLRAVLPPLLHEGDEVLRVLAEVGEGTVVHRPISGSWQASVIASTSASVGAWRTSRAVVRVTGGIPPA